MFQRMLVPLDGSSRAERALPVAARLAQASGGRKCQNSEHDRESSRKVGKPLPK